jgi:protein-tyrosine phosphatase
MKKILFVCLGNICRSPAAEGVLSSMAKSEGINLEIASCGLGDWHRGQLPDPRMRQVAEQRGYILTSRAQGIKQEHFEHYDLILAADQAVFLELMKRANHIDHKGKIHLMTKFSRTYPLKEIPDPFYGNTADFELALDMIEDACEGILGYF